ncbi:MAG: undecaprenyldiphospho-muramoylpentapeptide beta-N-acetylglucosaminyltransferase [Acidobacteriota bacterium]
MSRNTANERTPHVLLAGGGSGGHIFPALALATELVSRGWRVSFAGTPASMESRLVPEHGIEFHALAARAVLGKGALDKALALATLVRSSLAARRLVREIDATVVVGTGGYASAPAVLGGRLARRPVLLFEPNAHAGKANRFLSRFASAGAVGFAAAAPELRCPTVVTGVPVRPEFFAVPEDLPGAPAPALLVLGGSQGARSLNRELPRAIAALAPTVPGLRVMHQAGAKNVDETQALYDALGVTPETVTVVAFLDRVAQSMADSDLVISRAGAITLAEICAASRPALLLPLGVAAGHQVDNAGMLEQAGAARVLTPEQASAAGIEAALAELLSNRAALARMARAARAAAQPGAVVTLADRVQALAKEAA